MALYNLTGINLDIFNAVNSAGYVFIFTAVVLPSFSLCMLTAIALFLAHSLNWPVRIALINIFAGEMTLWISYAMNYLGYPGRAYDPVGVVNCRFFLSASLASVVASLSAIAVYAVIVYIFIKYGIKNLNLKYIFLVTVCVCVCVCVRVCVCACVCVCVCKL